MTIQPNSALLEIPPLMPQFLRKRRAGIAAPDLIAERLGITRPELFTLVQLHLIQGSVGFDAPMSMSQSRAWARYAYSVKDHLSDHVAALRKHGLVDVPIEGSYTLTPEGRAAAEKFQAAGRAHVATHQPLPPEDLRTLAQQLERAVKAIMADPILAPRPGSHLAGSRALASLSPYSPNDPNVAPMVRIEQAIYDLWLARDDSHTKAWRDAGMEGPPMQVLSLIWSGEATTVSKLTEMLHADQSLEDVEASLAYLFEKDYVVREGDEVTLTPAGVLAREDIESETNRIYFASWPYTEQEAAWIRDKLRDLIANLPTPGNPS